MLATAQTRVARLLWHIDVAVANLLRQFVESIECTAHVERRAVPCTLLLALVQVGERRPNVVRRSHVAPWNRRCAAAMHNTNGVVSRFHAARWSMQGGGGRRRWRFAAALSDVGVVGTAAHVWWKNVGKR